MPAVKAWSPNSNSGWARWYSAVSRSRISPPSSATGRCAPWCASRASTCCPGPRRCASGRRVSCCCALWICSRAGSRSGRMCPMPRCWILWKTGWPPGWARSIGWRTLPISIYRRSLPLCCPGRCPAIWMNRLHPTGRYPPARASVSTTAKPRRYWRCACRKCSATGQPRVSPTAAWR